MQVFTCSSLLLYTITPLLTDALSLDVSNSASIKNASSIVAKGVLTYYSGSKPGQDLGLFGAPYYWWQAGAVWSSFIDYWNYTGDGEYVDLVQQALLSQVGPSNNYVPPNQTKTEANDDQAIWGLAAMRAAELNFPSPSNAPTWLDLATKVFDDQVARWDTQKCGGGLRWQIFSFNDGYDYKNTQSNGDFFVLAARLARHTGNQTYADWATKTYDWTSSIGFITDDYKVYDGALTEGNCSVVDRLQWTYTAAGFLYGSAVMTNFTHSNATWMNRTNSLLSSMSVFFTQEVGNDQNTSTFTGIMSEVACETTDTCTTDSHTYKALAAQWMGETMQVAPFTTDTILGYLQSSAQGAARQCSGGPNGTTCGTLWRDARYDGKTGLGQELSALNVFLANLALNSSAPTTSSSGTTTIGTSGTATTSSSGTPLATSSSKPSSGSDSMSAASRTLSFLVPVALLFLSFF